MESTQFNLLRFMRIEIKFGLPLILWVFTVLKLLLVVQDWLVMLVFKRRFSAQTGPKLGKLNYILLKSRKLEL